MTDCESCCEHLPCNLVGLDERIVALGIDVEKAATTIAFARVEMIAYAVLRMILFPLLQLLLLGKLFQF